MSFAGLRHLVVGSGLWGAVLAERIASVLNERVVVVEKRGHVGGNCYSQFDATTGIECHAYGTHVFHTRDADTWSYIRRFTDFTPYRHKVLTQHRQRVYPMPIGLATLNAFYGVNLRPFEVSAFLLAEASKAGIANPDNLEDKAISMIGRPLYEAFIRGYTIKQWGRDPRMLSPDIITRLPVRVSYDESYFDDPYQGLPVGGYGALFKRMLNHPNIDVRLHTDFFDVRDAIPAGCRVFYSGPVDRLFGDRFGELEWRTARFEWQVHDVADYQGTAVMNFADEEVPFTRIHEFKHLHPERSHPAHRTITCTEYPSACASGEEPFYPVVDRANTARLALYRREVARHPGLLIGGRLGSFKYCDMDKAIQDALAAFESSFPRCSRSHS
jgi:UDP-galactopyranose mutase